MFKLAVKFRAAQYSLVQELLQEHAGWEPEHLRSGSMKALNLCDVPVAPLLQRLQQQQQQPQLAPTLSPRAAQQQQARKPVQDMLADCLHERVIKSIGRGAGERSLSIHDGSPYTVALMMRDAAFFLLPAILAHTQSLWQGTELQMMQTLVHGGVEAGDQRPGLDMKHRSSRSSSRPLGRGKLKLMSAAAFMDAGAANNSSNVAAGCNADSSSKPGSWLGNLSEGHDGWPAGMMLEAGAAGGCAAGDAICSLAVCAPGTVNTTSDFNSRQSSIAEQHPYLQQAEAVVQTGPGPFAEGVEFDSQGLYNSTAATCRQSSPAAGYSSSQSSSASATLSSLSFKKPKHDDPWLNPGVGLELMQNMGIAGSGRQPFARAASSLLHAALLAPRALHNSPRGRWLVRCLFEAIFLVMYQVSYHVVLALGVCLWRCVAMAAFDLMSQRLLQLPVIWFEHDFRQW